MSVQIMSNFLISSCQQWDADLAEAEYIKDLDDNLSIIRLRFGDSSKPLFKKREFIVYERRETMDDGTLVCILLQKEKNNSIFCSSYGICQWPLRSL